MKNHQYLSNFSHDDVIKFEENSIHRIGKIKALLRPFFENKEWAEQKLRDYLLKKVLQLKKFLK